MKKNGILFVILGPSGAGKTTLAKIIFEKLSNKLNFLTTYTTRSIREGEQHGIDYNFVDHDNFENLKNNNFFLEVVQIEKNYYGTPRKYLDRLENGENILLILDRNGLISWKNFYNNIKSFWLTIPAREIENRLVNRKNNNNFLIKNRIKIDTEMEELEKMYPESNFYIENIDLEVTKDFLIKKINESLEK